MLGHVKEILRFLSTCMYFFFGGGGSFSFLLFFSFTDNKFTWFSLLHFSTAYDCDEKADSKNSDDHDYQVIIISLRSKFYALLIPGATLDASNHKSSQKFSSV